MSLLKPAGVEFRRVSSAQEFGRVAVLLGGRSAERDISLLSGRAVLAALERRGVDAQPFDPAGAPLATLVGAGFDRAFVALHGPGGEDGTLQGALEWLGLPHNRRGVVRPARTKVRVAQVEVRERLVRVDAQRPPVGGRRPRRIAGGGFVEFMPERDVAGQGALTAAQCLTSILGIVARQR